MNQSSTAVDVIYNPTQTELQRRYIDLSKPVIIKESFMDMRVINEWSPEFFQSREFREIIADHKVHILVRNESNNSTFSEDKKFTWKEMTFDEFVDIMLADTSESERYYLAQQSVRNFPGLSQWFYKPACVPERSYPMTMWMGKKSVTPLHYDANHNIFCQVYGRKKIILVSPEDYGNVYMNPDKRQKHMSLVRNAENPDLTKYPDFQKATKFEFELGPGDALFIPKGWLHYLRTSEVSVSINFWCPTWYAMAFSKIKQSFLSILRPKK